MKSLNDYTQKPTTELLEKTGAFFAFSTEQFKKAAKEGVKYGQAGLGLIAPLDQIKTVVDGIERISREGIAQDIAENGKEAIIRRELHNHECFYTYDTSDCVERLADYKFTDEEIEEVFRKENKRILDAAE